MRWLLVGVIVLLFILPFAAFNDAFLRLGVRIAAAPTPSWFTGGIIALLLALDVVLPVPSSVLNTAAGALLGLWKGAMACWLGMTAGCFLGYELGSHGARRLARRVAGPDELERVSKMVTRKGNWVIIVFRAVPVLAEASVIFAGMTRMPLRQFALPITLSNLGISLAYAAVGAYSVGLESFVLAFAGALLLPAIAIGIAHLSGR